MNYKLNPLAVIFWIICGLVGYLIGDSRGAIIGLASAMSLSFLVSVIDFF